MKRVTLVPDKMVGMTIYQKAFGMAERKNGKRQICVTVPEWLGVAPGDWVMLTTVKQEDVDDLDD